ncbi:MAG: phage holin family protein [Actinobacteria bacterium]|jgi:putative membrane protein|nr:phage holin family protein [Aquiluna sp.]MDA0247042.1 phage holin family protein [Actinomycetota bacterium]MDA2976122.1 phage holin family protein [Actinomycetota bacterium]MDA8549857.1 phage holin family protein [Aquiluna sp.]
MLRFLVSTIVNAVGLFVATSLVPQVNITPYGGDGVWETIASFLLIGAMFGIVNAVIAPVIKVLAFPLYIITFGLIAFVINGAMLLLVAWLSGLIGSEILTIEGFTSEGLTIDSLGWAILAAIVMSIASFLTRSVLRILKIK